mmetsp:Transcript_9904/g.26135  ORF Transcript_9904/g.26135 Transcript_9904/m.26135 type:complete len:318 (-) Transcript_9904:965-1918(-)
MRLSCSPAPKSSRSARLGLAVLCGSLGLRRGILAAIGDDLWRLFRHVLVVFLVEGRLDLAGLRDRALPQRLAHVREQTLHLLIHLLLSRLRLLQQSPGLPVLRVQLDDTFAVLHALREILQPELGLCAPEDGLHVLRIFLQHGVACRLRVRVLLEFQEASGLVQLAGALELFRRLLVFLLEVFDVVEEVGDLFVTLEGHHEAPALKQGRADVFAGGAKFDLLLLRQTPRVLGLFPVLHFQCELDLVRLQVLESQLCLGNCRGAVSCHCEERALALFHVNRGELQRVADLAVADGELQHFRREAGERRARRIHGGLHG